MALTIEKRTRTVNTDNWGEWAVTTDAPPYDNTEFVEYRAARDYAQHAPVSIDIEDLTSGEITSGADDEFVWQGSGIFDKLMESVNGNIKVEYDNGRIVGQNYAATYLGGLQAAMSIASQFLLNKDTAMAKADGARVATTSAEYTFDNILPIQRNKAEEDYDLLEDTHDSKVRLAGYQADKAEADVKYVGTQTTSLTQAVIDNRAIKALDSLADTYGTFGAGGLTMSKDMWRTYYTLVARLVSSLNDYKGEWNAATNSPDISAILDPVAGDFYRVSADGTTNLDGSSDWVKGDLVVYTSGVNGELGNGYWRKADVVLPDSTAVGQASDTTPA